MTHIEQRADTAANWTSENPVLNAGEVGWETDTLKAKLGTGTHTWNLLPYAIFSGGAVTSVAGKTGAVSLNKADVGLGNVNNTADSAKPVSVLQQAALDLKAALASPAFTGNPTAPTPLISDDDTSIATTAFVKAVIEAMPDLASNTLVIGELRISWGSLSTALGGAASISQTVTFPIPFSDDPAFVFINIQTGAVNKLIASLANVSPTATAFDLAVKTGDGTTSTATPTVYWFAVGPS